MGCQCKANFGAVHGRHKSFQQQGARMQMSIQQQKDKNCKYHEGYLILLLRTLLPLRPWAVVLLGVAGDPSPPHLLVRAGGSKRVWW